MGVYKRENGSWQVKVRKAGVHLSKIFASKAEADDYEQQILYEISRKAYRDRREAERMTLGALLRRYKEEVTPTKRSASIESIKLDVILRDKHLPLVRMSELTGKDIAEWRDRRLEHVTGATVNREIDVLSTAINHARREWGVNIPENPVHMVKRPKKANQRARRVANEEERYLIAALTPTQRREDGTFEKSARNPWLCPLVLLAIETAMRRGELLALDWEHVDLKNRTAHLPTTKNGDARTVPLSTRAVQILKALPGDDHTKGPVFPTTANALRKGFTRALARAREAYLQDCAQAGTAPRAKFLVDVHFHDTRHEAATRLSKKLSNVLELSAVTGHKDLRMLQRYYHPDASELAKKLG